MTNRRTFIKKISAIGATAPLVTNLKGESSKKVLEALEVLELRGRYNLMRG